MNPTTNYQPQYQGPNLTNYNSNTPPIKPESPPQRVMMPSQPTTPQPTNNNESPHLENTNYRSSSPSNENPKYTPQNYMLKDRKNSLIHESCPSFGQTEYAHNIISMDRHTTIDVRLHTKIDRGFFLADNDWTCYRRNYFQVSGSFSLEGIGILYEGQEIPCLVKDPMGHLEEIHCFMLGVSARLSDCDKSIQLIQHTPKRDKGPQTTPTPKLIRPGGNIGFSSVGSSQSIVTFERLQFKTATANNGKRRAAQQYYVIVIELLVKLRNGNTLTVATAKSAPLVVRGRSPGHYAESDAGIKRQHRQSTGGGPISTMIQHPTHLPYHRPSLIHSPTTYPPNSNVLFQSNPTTPTGPPPPSQQQQQQQQPQPPHSGTTTPSNEYMPYDYHGVPSYNYGHIPPPPPPPTQYPSSAIPMMQPQHHYLPHDRSHSTDSGYIHHEHEYDQTKLEQPTPQPHPSPYYWQRQERYEEQQHPQEYRMRMPSSSTTTSSIEHSHSPYLNHPQQQRSQQDYYPPYGHHSSYHPPPSINQPPPPPPPSSQMNQPPSMNQTLPPPSAANHDHYYQQQHQHQHQQHYDWRTNNKMSYYDEHRDFDRQQPQQSPTTSSPLLNRETTIVK